MVEDGMQAPMENFIYVMNSHKILERMTELSANLSKVPMIDFMMQCLEIVLVMITFQKALRTGDWGLHLISI